MAGLTDDPSDRPTRMADYGAIDLEHQPDGTDPAAPDFAPDPWYRNRVLLALWALMIALLLTLIIYGLVELSRGGGSSIPAPHSTTTPTRSSTTSPSPTATTPPITPSTTTEAPPPPETPEPTPEQTPEPAPPPANTPAPTETPRHHHHWHLPHLF